MLTRLLIISLILMCSKCVLAQYDSITITYRDLSFGKKKYKASHRLHVSNVGDGQVLLESIDSYKLPTYFKKFRVTTEHSNTRFTFSRSDAFEFAMPLIDSQVAQIDRDTIFFTDKNSKIKLMKTYTQNSKKYFAGKHGGNFFKNYWVPLYLVPLSEAESSLTIDIQGTFLKKARYKTDKLPIGFAPLLPTLDTTQCVPFDRFHELRKMKGYGIDNFKYIPYRMPSRTTVRQQFEIYFDKNSSDAKPESVQAVIDYLRSNNYSILNATIEGYSSIEGDDQRNTRLQQKRARVLLDLLQKYNSEPIIRDTVIINPGFELFRQAIKQTPYQWLDSLSDEKLRASINSNQILLSAVEPYLKPQRKAVLKLVVAKRIEGAEVIDRFRKDFTFLEMLLNPERSQRLPPADVESRLMGMIAYLFNLLENGFISTAETAEIIDGALNNEVVRVLTVYHHIIQFEKKTSRDSLEWDNLSNKYHYNQLFHIAQTNLILLIGNPIYYKQRDKFKQQLVDIQTYSFDYTLMNWISPATLCEMTYPDKPDFRGYKLNQLAFLQYLAKYKDVPCEKLTIADQPEFKKYTDQWLDTIQKSSTITDTTLLTLKNTDDHNTKADLTSNLIPHFAKTADGKYYPRYGKEVYSPLLFYLKKLFVKDEASITQYMKVSDNLIAFDIYTLANYHISVWDPFTNFFADREVQLAEMDKVIGLLKKGDAKICPEQVNQLYLNYHLKALHYITRYFEPGNAKQTDIAQRSLQFITNYYSKRAGLVTPRLSMYILLQLNAFHRIPGRYDGTWYAWSLLQAIKIQRELTKDEFYLYKKYQRLYQNNN